MSHIFFFSSSSFFSLGLFQVAGRLASALSGGMKRRLCVAIALAGCSRVVFLDEPTTGLDPVSKRQLWQIISSSKAGRSVVLTTHDLFEAEILSQRIGIMGLGVLKALGTPLHLKTKFATGYRVVVDFRGGAFDEVRFRALLGEDCELNVLNSFTSSREYCLLLKENISIGTVFDLMSREASSLGISAWTLGNLGIESVFERVFAETHSNNDGPQVVIN